MKKAILFILAFVISTPLAFADGEKNTKKKSLVKHLKQISVTIKSTKKTRWGDSSSEGSGVIVTRKIKDKKGNTHIVNFVWTAGHVVDNLRSTRQVNDPKTGSTRTVVEFSRPSIVQELIDKKSGQRIGEVKLDTVVLCYSDADTGEDLALLMVLKKDFLVDDGAKFYLNKAIPPQLTDIVHVGSRHGQFGANSFSSGEISSIGRVLKLSGATSKIFDQTSVPASPGSSGGGVYFKSGANAGKCLGLIVRGGEATFNFIVPVRRMHSWAKKMNVEFALNPNAETPLLEDLTKITIEDGWINRHGGKDEKKGAKKPKKSFSIEKNTIRKIIKDSSKIRTFNIKILETPAKKEKALKVVKK